MIHKLKNVYLSRHGSILDENFNLLEVPSDLFIKWEKVYQKLDYDEIKKYTLDKVKDNKMIKLDDRKFIYAYPYFNIYVYGHIWDSIRQLKEIEENKIEGTLLIGINSGHINDLYHHLEIFGYDKSKTFSCNCREHVYFIKNLIVPTDEVYIAHLNMEQLLWLRNKYFYNNKKLDNTKINNEENLKLYLTREKEPRKVINESEVWEFLKTNGYIKLNGKESLEEHLYYFSNSIKIIGPHGSLFRNAIFSFKNPDIHEFCPKNRKDISIMNLNKLWNKNYTQYLVEATDDYDINIDIKILKKII